MDSLNYKGHLSLHFDGVRVNASIAHNIGDLCSNCSDYIFDRTGFRVKICEKKHFGLLELVKLHAESGVVADVAHDHLLSSGNCIPAALSRIVDPSDDIRRSFDDQSSQSNVQAANRGCRTYCSEAAAWHAHLMPAIGLRIKNDGAYLVHSECSGAPHCVAVKVNAGVVSVYDGKDVMTLELSRIEALADEATDAQTIITYVVNTPPGSAAWKEAAEVPDEIREILLNMEAGGRESEVALDDDFVDQVECSGAIDEAGPDTFDEVDEGTVNPGDALLILLGNEVSEFSRDLRKDRPKTKRSNFSCSLCPFRDFKTKRRLQAHVKNYHDRRHQYTCSGTKQLKIITALYDDDCISAITKKASYLARSAALLRNVVKPPVPGNVNIIDKHLRLVLSADGPTYANVRRVQISHVHRRVRNLYYDRGFAEVLRAEMLMHNARMKSVLPRLVLPAREGGNALSCLYPNKVSCWWPVVEDIFMSEPVRSLKDELMMKLVEATEFEYLSVDATMRCCLSVMGQIHPRNTSARSAFAGDDCMRRVLTVRGRTNAVLVMAPVPKEDVGSYVMVLDEHVLVAAKAQVRHVACDNPSRKMWKALTEIFPNITTLCLDTVHLAMSYEYAHWHRRTEGSRVLRLAMSKFHVYDETLPSGTWGGPYTGGTDRPLTREEPFYSTLVTALIDMW